MLPDLTTITLTLRPRKHNRIPAWQGRAAQALLYSTLAIIHSQVSETIHNLNQWQPMMPKPFTMSTLLGARICGQGDLIELHPARPLHLQLTTLHWQMSGIVLNGVLPLWKRYGIRLHDQPLWVAHTQITRTSYTELLNHANDNDCIALDFTAPTAFNRTEGGYLAQPDVNYIFKSLFNRWNKLAPEPLPVDLATVLSHLQVIHTSVQHRDMKFARGHKGIIPGFFGQIQIEVNYPSQDVRRIVNALAAFAPFSGVGIKTTIGMGQVALIA